MKIVIHLNSLSELPSDAKQFIFACQHKRKFAFYGEMGVGKTTFIKSVCEYLGVKDTVNSPTFSIVNEYHTIKVEKIFHFDFYRIKAIAEAYDLGYEDYFYSDSYVFIEWPEKVEELLPEDVVRVYMSIQEGKRTIEFESLSDGNLLISQ